MIRLIHKRLTTSPDGYRRHKAWRVGTPRWHISVPKPGSGVCWSIQLGPHLIAVTRL